MHQEIPTNRLELTQTLTVNEDVLVAILNTESTIEALRDAVVDGLLTPELFLVLEKTLELTESAFGLHERIEILNKLKEEGGLSDPLYDVLISAYLEMDTKTDVLAYKMLMKKAGGILAKHPDEVPENEVATLRGETTKLSRDQFEFARKRMGESLLRQAENPDRVTTDAELLIKTAKLVFGDEQGRLMDAVYHLYKMAHDKKGFLLSFRPTGEPLYTLTSMFEISNRSRGLLKDADVALAGDEISLQKARILLVEEFLLSRDRDENRRQHIRKVQAQEKKESEFLKATGVIEAINREAVSTLEGWQDKGMEEDLRTHHTETERKLGAAVDELAQTTSLPLAEHSLLAILRLQSLMNALQAGEFKAEEDATPEALLEQLNGALEARAMVLETRARDFNAYEVDLGDRLVGETDPDRKEKLRANIRWADAKSQQLFVLAEELREAAHA